MSEVWKDIKGYEGIYQVSNLGRVRSLDRVVSLKNRYVKFQRIEKGRIMAQKLTNNYLQVSLRKVVNSIRQRKTFCVHRLVAEAFIPNLDNKPTVNHINEDPRDNRAKNLEWMTWAENLRYGTRIERSTKANSMPVEQLTVEGKHVAYFDSMQEASRQTGCQYGSLWRCCYGRQEITKGFRFRFTTEFRRLLRDRKQMQANEDKP